MYDVIIKGFMETSTSTEIKEYEKALRSR